MSQGTCRDCGKRRVRVNDDGLCTLCADQLVIPLPAVRDKSGRFRSLGGGRDGR